jgi:ATP-dependent Clp protease adaptor protein ClpS
MSESEKAREGASAGEGAVAKPNEKPKSSAGKTGKPQARAKKAVRTGTRRKTKQLPPYNVVLLDDDDHTIDYVVEMLRKLFAHPVERSMQMVKEIDESGRVIVFTTHKELAELKRDQILAYGRDTRISACRGSMTAIIEPAQG